MKTIKKIYLLSVLVLAVTAQGAPANIITTDTRIHNAVEARLAKNFANAKDLATTLGSLKIEILAIIDAAPDAANYATLRAAVDKLEPEKMLAMVIHLKTVLKSMPDNTSALILAKVPMPFRLALQ
ncbi:MAG: hypothetical protein NTZ68_03850 [Candidatus Dependentiae bacterium]|nr:hypothetical protein [Candidatus Dependentiae bacterium]